MLTEAAPAHQLSLLWFIVPQQLHSADQHLLCEQQTNEIEHFKRELLLCGTNCHLPLDPQRDYIHLRNHSNIHVYSELWRKIS